MKGLWRIGKEKYGVGRHEMECPETVNAKSVKAENMS